MSNEFEKLGEGLCKALLQAAEDHVSRANQALDQTKAMVEILQQQIVAQAKQLEEMTTRYKAFGEKMLDAHRMLDGNKGTEVNLLDALHDGSGLRAASGFRVSPDVARQVRAADYPGADRGNPRDLDGSADLRRKMEARLSLAADAHHTQRQRPDSGDPDPAF